MEAGQIAAGGLSDAGRTNVRAGGTDHVRGRRLALVAGAVLAAFGGAFAVGASTSTKTLAPARLAPALGSAQPSALKIAVTPSVSVPTLVRLPKAKPKPKPAARASTPAPVVAAAPVIAAPVATRVTPVVVTHVGGVPTPTVTQPVTTPVTHPSGSTTGTKTTSNSGTGTVSGSG